MTGVEQLIPEIQRVSTAKLKTDLKILNFLLFLNLKFNAGQIFENQALTTQQVCKKVFFTEDYQNS